MNQAQKTRKRQIDRVVDCSVLWEQLSRTEGREGTYFLYCANVHDRASVATNIMALFKDAKLTLSSDTLEGEQYTTLRIPQNAAEELRPYYQEKDRYVGPNLTRGGGRLSDTPPGEHAISVLESNLSNAELGRV